MWHWWIPWYKLKKKFFWKIVKFKPVWTSPEWTFLKCFLKVLTSKNVFPHLSQADVFELLRFFFFFFAVSFFTSWSVKLFSRLSIFLTSSSWVPVWRTASICWLCDFQILSFFLLHLPISPLLFKKKKKKEIRNCLFIFCFWGREKIY